MIQAVEQVEPFDRTVLTMIEVPADELVLVRVRLLLDRIVEDQHAVFTLHRAHHRLDLLPQVFRRVVGLRQKARHLVMANLAVH